MAQKTSINIKPCNVGSSSPHNRRSAEYLANIRKEKLYIRTDLMERNEAWVAPELGDTSLADRYKQIAAMVKEKTGRAMQTKDRERVNKKTGKVTIVRGSTPLKEGVVVIKEDTTMKQLQNFCKVRFFRWGITALQIIIHRNRLDVKCWPVIQVLYASTTKEMIHTHSILLFPKSVGQYARYVRAVLFFRSWTILPENSFILFWAVY